MRASGRGGRQGPQGGSGPPAGPSCVLLRLNAHRSPSAFWTLLLFHYL